MGFRGGDVHEKIHEYMRRKHEKQKRRADETRVEEWIVKMMNDNVSFSSTWSICRVPEKLRSIKNEAYNPQLVSIGPIHYEDPRLRSMEDQKQHYLISLLQRTQPDVLMSLDTCCFTILNLDEEVRACYADSIEPDKIKLAKILLQDAGFMLELFLRCYNIDSTTVQDDPLFTTWMKLSLERDLALFENQIPFLVLESLYKFVVPPGVLSLTDLALHFYKSTLNIDDETYRGKCKFEGKHLLHLLYNCYLPLPRKMGKKNMETLRFIPNATALKYAGVLFKRSKSNNLFDLEFNNGVFNIPTLRVHGATDSLFRNFIAMEQCRRERDTPHYVTSYCMLLDRLVDDAKDVELLVDQQIIENHLGDGSEVSGVFNDICKEVDLKDFYFAELCDEVNSYSEDAWHSYKADLRLNYFNNPWSTISFIGAIILLALTFLQTLYSVLAFYQTRHRPTAIIAVFSSLGGILFLAFLAFGVWILIKKKNKNWILIKKSKKKRDSETKVDEHLKVKKAISVLEIDRKATETATPSSSNDPAAHHRRPKV